MAHFYTLEEAQQDWPGGGLSLNTEYVQQVLDVAESECLAFAPLPSGAGPEDVPIGHRQAHLMHARNIWNASKVNPSGAMGDDSQGFALTPFPLDWAVKARLRPRVIFGGTVG
jgi:hypothetical protein